MPAGLAGLPVFYEEFDPARGTRFDRELDELTKAYALERRRLKGFCNLTGCDTEFTVSSENLREDVVSPLSHSINRHRQVVCALSLTLFGHPSASLEEVAAHVNRERLKLYTAEAHSPLFRLLAQWLDPELLVASEYFGPQHRSGEVVGGTLHQDLQRTSFEDETFDIVLTFEVFEHIPDALAAEREVVRILKGGGFYCFTVPFLPESEHDLVLAELDERGEVRHHAEPQYHGDPVRPDEGVLVYRLFSFHDLKRRFSGLGCQFKSYRFWSKALGIIDDNGWVHVVGKPAARASERGAAGSGLSEAAQLRAQLAALRTRFDEQSAALSLSQARVSEHEEQLGRQAAALAELAGKLEERDSDIADLRERLSGVEDELRRKEEVLDWLQTSRSWRAASLLRRAGDGARRVLRLTGAGAFSGAVETPAEGARCAGTLDVSGWVYSRAAPVTRVEAFLDDLYLGRLSYGVERAGTPDAQPGAPAACGFADSLSLHAEHAGGRVLRIRIFDGRGNQRTYARHINVEA